MTFEIYTVATIQVLLTSYCRLYCENYKDILDVRCRSSLHEWRPETIAYVHRLDSVAKHLTQQPHKITSPDLVFPCRR